MEVERAKPSVRAGLGRCAGVAVGVLTLFLAAGCANPEAVVDEEAVDEARGAHTMPEVAAVEEFLADDPRGPATELLPTAYGVLALFESEVASFGVDPVAEAWSYETSGPVHDASVWWTGEAVLLRHEADLGPVSRDRTLVLNTERGRVIHSATLRDEAVPEEGHLMREAWVAAEPDGTLVARNLSDGEVAWEHDLSETCSSGGVDEVALAAAGARLLTAHACTEDGSAHAAALGGEGTPFWEESWQDAPAPRVHVVHEHTVPGSPQDPITRMFDEQLSGGFLFIDQAQANSMTPLSPEPWHSAPGVGEYADEPLQDFETAPRDIVMHSSPPGHLRDLLVLQAARWLAEDESVPFTKDDLDDSLLIDGEFVHSPRQWPTGASGYISALEDELENAFP